MFAIFQQGGFSAPFQKSVQSIKKTILNTCCIGWFTNVNYIMWKTDLSKNTVEGQKRIPGI
jgi:hypothetical protein